MSNIDTYLAKIMSAVYGEEVRGSIHDAIEKCYTDTTTGKTTADTAAASANAAATRANTAASEAEEIADDMDGLVKVQNTQPSEAINKVWFDTTGNGEYTLPEVDDSTVSDEDTWSSQKIRNEIDAGDADLKRAIQFAKKSPDITTDGYGISSSGVSNMNSNYRLIKYRVNAGDKLLIIAPTPPATKAAYQFQSSANVPETNNTYIVGDTVTVATHEEVVVPSGATWLIFSALNTDDLSGLYVSDAIEGLADKMTDYVLAESQKVQHGLFTIPLETGTYSDNDGATKVANTNRIRTANMVALKDFATIEIPSEYSAWILMFDSSAAFISAYGSSWYSGTIYSNMFSSSVKFINIVFRKTDSSLLSE